VTETAQRLKMNRSVRRSRRKSKYCSMRVRKNFGYLNFEEKKEAKVKKKKVKEKKVKEKKVKEKKVKKQVKEELVWLKL